MLSLRLSLLVVAGLSVAQAADTPVLERTLKKQIAGIDGTVSLYAKNLETGQAVGIRSAEPIRTASTIKLPILLAVFDAVHKGEARWTELLTVSAKEKVSGSGVISSELSDGVQLPLRDVANLMIVLSDNTATNLLIERFGADRVNAYLNGIKLPGTRLLRKIRGDGTVLKSPSGWSAAGRLPENEKYGIGRSTTKEMVAILELLYRGRAVSAVASREMLAILERCQDDNGIRRRLNGVRVANKTGALDALRADTGIVYSSGGPIAIAINVDGMPKPDWSPDNPGSLLIARLAEIVVSGLAAK
jgi:beta-lactamase class A